MKSARRLKKHAGVDLTPMVDVIFLLVIFFLTSTSLVKVKALRLDLPQSSESKPVLQEQLTVSVRQNGELLLQGKAVSEADLVQQLQRLMAERPKPEDKTLLVEGDKRVSYETIVAVMNLAKKSGVARLSLATTQ